MSTEVTESQFYMWRTLFAVAHADDIVTDEEIEFMAHVLDDVNFSEEQTKILKNDIINPQDIELMFDGITSEKDRLQFFDFARDLVWVDGDFGAEEQSVMVKLHQKHFKNTNFDSLIGHVSLELEGDSDASITAVSKEDVQEGGFMNALKTFRRSFFGD